MSLTQEQIHRLGKLTALSSWSHLSVESVLDSFDSLGKTDTSMMEGVSRSGKQTMSLRSDDVLNSGIADSLLACSSQKKAAHQIVLWWIIAWE